MPIGTIEGDVCRVYAFTGCIRVNLPATHTILLIFRSRRFLPVFGEFRVAGCLGVDLIHYLRDEPTRRGDRVQLGMTSKFLPF